MTGLPLGPNHLEARWGAQPHRLQWGVFNRRPQGRDPTEESPPLHGAASGLGARARAVDDAPTARGRREQPPCVAFMGAAPRTCSFVVFAVFCFFGAIVAATPPQLKRRVARQRQAIF